MKSRLAVLVVSTMFLGGTALCQAMPLPRGQQRPGCDEPSSREPFPPDLSRVLKLSETQKGQIRTILQDERDKGYQKETELHQRLRQAERGATFNEQEVRTAAAALAGLETERLVSRARVHYRINTVLTAAQRALAERLVPEEAGRPAPPREGATEGASHHGPDDSLEGR